jgi:hypothetical protein
MGERNGKANGARKPNGNANGRSFPGDTINKRTEAEAALCRHYIAAGMKPIDAVRRLATIVDPAATWQQRKPGDSPSRKTNGSP